MAPGLIDTVDDLQAYLHRAMMLEHSTIPPYLTALYSIHPGTNSAAVHVLRTVAVEEMLHLTIVANLINATGGTPDLTRGDYPPGHHELRQEGFVPSYPAYLADGEKRFKVGLCKFSRAALETFLLIEQPRQVATGKPKLLDAEATVGPSMVSCPLDHTKEYASIGDFYAEIQRGLDHLHHKLGPSLFKPNADKQVTKEYYYSGGGVLELIIDITSAHRQLRLIVEQGEGYGGGIYDHKKELAHYYRFMELKNGKYYEPGNSAKNPTGPELVVEWDKVYPMAENAKIADFLDFELRSAATAFNVSYAQYLAKLSDAFNGQPALMQEAVPMMFDIRYRMEQLMRVPLDDDSGNNAGPTFEIRT
jgi:hypothetical protein